MQFYPIAFSIAYTLSFSIFLGACQSSSESPTGHIIQGTISYPFYVETDPIGKNGKDDKFVIRTISGDTEYVVEIPHAATDYDVAIPIAQLNENAKKKHTIRNAHITDRELTASFPKLDQEVQNERSLMDKAFGVMESGGPTQAPSYTIGLTKIGNLYQERKYEFALIEANNLLSFFPNSTRLYKMKGSILVRLGNLKLAEKSWTRAAELSPDDPVIKKGLERLRSQLLPLKGTAPAAGS